jgi:LytS/YehU family sensor histidine kinase
MQFISSYFSLLKARYCEAVQLGIKVTDADLDKMLPPLSLQVIIENALYQNKTSKSSPLQIAIESVGDDKVIIRNNIQRKILTETTDQESGLDNLIKKYELMGKQPVEIKETGNERTIVLPLINKTAEVVA